MAMFGSNWSDDSDNDYDGLFSRWSRDDKWLGAPQIQTKTTDEILDEIDISEIEKYLRKKKLQNINKNERQK